jgi:hypothetical protein
MRHCRSGGKRIYISLEPQPDKETVHTLTRYYSHLLADKSYRRRVTWLTKSDGTMGDLVVYEYFGRHVQGRPHGNTKNFAGKDPFVRTPAFVMDEISDRVQKRRPQEVYDDLKNELDIDEVPETRASSETKKATKRHLVKRAATTLQMNSSASTI